MGKKEGRTTASSVCTCSSSSLSADDSPSEVLLSDELESLLPEDPLFFFFFSFSVCSLPLESESEESEDLDDDDDASLPDEEAGRPGKKSLSSLSESSSAMSDRSSDPLASAILRLCTSIYSVQQRNCSESVQLTQDSYVSLETLLTFMTRCRKARFILNCAHRGHH